MLLETVLMSQCEGVCIPERQYKLKCISDQYLYAVPVIVYHCVHNRPLICMTLIYSSLVFNYYFHSGDRNDECSVSLCVRVCAGVCVCKGGWVGPCVCKEWNE